MMVTNTRQPMGPIGLVLTGEAQSWQPALEEIVGPDLLTAYRVQSERELIEVVQSGLADAAVLDEDVEWHMDVLQMLRMIRRVDAVLPVVVLSRRQDRIWMEDALNLAAFSVVTKPLQLETLLRQVQRVMNRINQMLGDNL